MKKLLLLLFLLTSLLLSCSKKEQAPPPAIQKTWISGKWKRTFFGDTTFYRDGRKVFTQNSQQNELDFVDTSHVKKTSTGSELWPYSLSTMTVTFDNGNGAIYKITKISDTKMKLYWKYPAGSTVILAIGWVDEYEKE